MNPTPRRGLVLLAGLLAVPAQAQQNAPSPDVSERIARVERGLLPPIHVRGRPARPMDLEERMRHYRVPAVSIAVMEAGELAWVRAWGLASVEDGRPATPETRFQAASISKPVAAVAALELVERGEIGLDEDLEPHLAPWTVPRVPGIEGALTLRRLLGHTSGLTVHGFAGYQQGVPLPGTLEVLDGVKPANSPRVRLVAEPGTRWRYSGGGYTVVQHLVETLAERPFPETVRPVLDALGMARSTFRQPLPDSLRDEVARGYREDGSMLPGGWHAYPETAAAGLWTTPADLARFALAVGRGWRGEEEGALSPAMTREMLTPGPGGWGLGPATEGEGLDSRILHAGANEGFRSLLMYYPERGLGAVILTNGDAGRSLIGEVLLAIATEYAWPEPRPLEVRALPLDAEGAREYAGRFRVSEAPDVSLTIRWRDGRLEARAGGGPPTELVPVARDRFIRMSDGRTVRFERAPSGGVAAVVAEGVRARRVAPP